MPDETHTFQADNGDTVTVRRSQADPGLVVVERFITPEQIVDDKP
jgi:hypothetical protein